jgi:uncharacterized protein (TIGR00725 family)
MEALKLIPQIFFDIIARVAPGMFALFILDSSGVLPWATLLQTVAAGKLDNNNVFGFAVVTSLVGAYILGHFLSLASKQLENFSEWFSPWIAADKQRRKPKKHKPPFTGWQSTVGSLRKEQEEHWKKVFPHYDWLRVHKADAGSLAVRIRAEYTMYFSLAAALLLSIFGPQPARPRFWLPWNLVAVSAGGFLLMRAHNTKGTFASCVEQLYKAAAATPEGKMRRIIVGVMGQGEGARQEDQDAAEALGELIAAEGWILLTGGRDAGIMRAANKGAKKIPQSLTIGVLPSASTPASPQIDIVIKTDMHEARNNINVLTSDIVVACGHLGPGTASEVALALKALKIVILLDCPETAYAFFKELGAIVRTDTPKNVINEIKTALRL